VPLLGETMQTAALRGTCLLIDGTFFSDDEPALMGITNSTAREMGHVPVSGTGGTLAWLATLQAKHRVYVHINNTNPMLNEAGREFEEVTRAGIRIGRDGDEFEI
jgi:pyrroloquinoline quinone biosynthesis protein B